MPKGRYERVACGAVSEKNKQAHNVNGEEQHMDKKMLLLFSTPPPPPRKNGRKAKSGMGKKRLENKKNPRLGWPLSPKTHICYSCSFLPRFNHHRIRQQTGLLALNAVGSFPTMSNNACVDHIVPWCVC